MCADLDHASPDGASGVTPSMLSGWERGRHTTSSRYRRLLAHYYGEPVHVLFAHQDESPIEASDSPRLITDPQSLRDAMINVVSSAEEYLAVAGSRSRDQNYLTAIETALHQRPSLVHYRLLFGSPRTQPLFEHLEHLLEIRDPQDRSLGMKTLHIGLIDTDLPERFFCACEHTAVVPLPSFISVYGFDCGVVLGPNAAMRLVDHARQGYAAASRVENPTVLRSLNADTTRDRYTA
ncbi:transcriptional regulator with XRE-family HTH domain [Lipingzhangella halophila]|uniref:Transcriptional regulator with XRE-family HTH domain n=1 Tax=Lipingzhangella halophila TaxID=1783352 RepID=A0A7W7RMQ9_9ACTN|nr:XRE family transcriptional regulator [Lipingzhangella halophila]MBB4934433.1 transcriptional regulator with XRE-family HTH domain [Lipingzhangella halophila]